MSSSPNRMLLDTSAAGRCYRTFLTSCASAKQLIHKQAKCLSQCSVETCKVILGKTGFSRSDLLWITILP